MPAIDQWLTGDTISPAEYICRTLRIPNDIGLLMAVNGALLMLTREYRWQKFGDETASEAAELMSIMFDGYLDGIDCLPPGITDLDGFFITDASGNTLQGL